MYSTVGVRVPIWRRTMLLNKCTTSFFPWENIPFVISMAMPCKQDNALGIAIPIFKIIWCMQKGINNHNHHRWKLILLTSKSILCRFAMRVMRRLVLYSSCANWATASVWGSLSPVPHSTSFREDRFFETSSATLITGTLCKSQLNRTCNRTKPKQIWLSIYIYQYQYTNGHLFTLFALCGIQLLHVSHILFQVFHYLSRTLLRLSKRKRHDGRLLVP